MENKLRDYRYSKDTEVMYRGEWQNITEVWFREEKIGLKQTGHLVDYSEIENIRN